MSDAGNGGELRERLVGLLETIASYNDRGYAWNGDTPERSERLRAEWEAELKALIAQIGESDLPPSIMAGLQSGELLHDSSGIYVGAARAWRETH